MTIKFKRTHHQFREGQVVDHLDEGTCRTMIAYHIAEEVSEPAAKHGSKGKATPRNDNKAIVDTDKTEVKAGAVE